MQTRKILVCFLIVFLAFAFVSFPEVHATDSTFGYTTAETANSTINGVMRGLSGATPLEGNGIANSITAYINTYNNIRSIKCALYLQADSTLYSSTEEKNVQNNGFAWSTFTFPDPPTITNGTAYIIIAWANGGSDLGRTTGTGLGRDETWANSTFPTTATFTTNNFKNSIYCSYTLSGAETSQKFQGNFNPTFSFGSAKTWDFSNQHSFSFSFGSSLNRFVGFNTINQFGLAFSLNQLRIWQFTSYRTIPFQLALNSIQNFAYSLPGLLTFYGDITATFTMKALKQVGFTTEQTIPFSFGIQSTTSILQLGVLTIWSSIGFTFQTLSSQYGLAEITLDYAFALAGLAFILAITGITITLVRRKGD